MPHTPLLNLIPAVVESSAVNAVNTLSQGPLMYTLLHYYVFCFRELTGPKAACVVPTKDGGDEALQPRPVSVSMNAANSYMVCFR